MDLIPLAVLETPVTVIGAGSLGSFTILTLAKMGWRNIKVVDHDDVDIVNMSCQFHGFNDIGKKKVISLAERIESMTGGTTKIIASPERWEGQTYNGVVVSAVDSMLVRKEIYEAHKMSFGTKYIIDPRMGAEVAAIYVINPHDLNDRRSYENSLSDDSKTVQEPCTAKSTTYTAILVGALVGQLVKDCLTKTNYQWSIDWNIKEGKYISWKKS